MSVTFSYGDNSVRLILGAALLKSDKSYAWFQKF